MNEEQGFQARLVENLNHDKARETPLNAASPISTKYAGSPMRTVHNAESSNQRSSKH